MMREERKDIWCAISFGKDYETARKAAVIDKKFGDDIEFTSIYNPLPTGDYWKPIMWARNFRDRGEVWLRKIPLNKRNFAKRAAVMLSDGPLRGFCMEITGRACRDYRDTNGLRSERGHVYVFVGVLLNKK